MNCSKCGSNMVPRADKVMCPKCGYYILKY